MAITLSGQNDNTGISMGTSGTLQDAYSPITVSGGYQDTATTSNQYLGDGTITIPQPLGAYSGTPNYTAPVDPYAKWGGQTNYNNLLSGFKAQENNIYGSATDATNAFGEKYNRSILNYLDSAKLGQDGVDSQATKNELAKMQGVTGIMGMVGRGINSGGVQLANRNAGDSSGAEAIARAYGTMGRQQMANVGNQYALGQEDVRTAQNTFDTQMQVGMRDLQGSKQDAINSIVNDARTQLADLDAQIANASLPDRIQIEQAKQRVQSQAIQALQGYDKQLTDGRSNIKAADYNTIRGNAATMQNAGKSLGADQFNYTTEAPMQFQNTGPSTSQLPIYTYKSKQA